MSGVDSCTDATVGPSRVPGHTPCASSCREYMVLSRVMLTLFPVVFYLNRVSGDKICISKIYMYIYISSYCPVLVRVRSHQGMVYAALVVTYVYDW